MNNEASKSIRDRYLSIAEAINNIVVKSGRSAGDVKLVVVTKAQPVEKIREVIEAGAIYLGENYPDETAEKIKQLSEYRNIEWHMIGHLQSRKIPLVLNGFKMFHSMDSFELAEKMSRKLHENKQTMPVLIEINTGGENSKYGFSGEDEANWNLLEENILKINDLPGIRVQGLMTMPPYFEEIEKSRVYFGKLKKLQETLKTKFSHLSQLNELSMGTSMDYRIAIEEGATYVRVGQAIMGERNYQL
jgi:pyridoxal phosphate enzyme (YggS family)